VRQITYGTNKFVQYAHSLVARRHHALLNADATLRDEAIKWPPKGQYQEPYECRPPEQTIIPPLVPAKNGSSDLHVKKNRCDDDLERTLNVTVSPSPTIRKQVAVLCDSCGRK
jgi:hypothetical protein